MFGELELEELITDVVSDAVHDDINITTKRVRVRSSIFTIVDLNQLVLSFIIVNIMRYVYTDGLSSIMALRLGCGNVTRRG
jgi:hypothetical protein